ncbi:MAG: hypothetical protein ACRDL7_16075 [Gaiellaceae bacterium]
MPGPSGVGNPLFGFILPFEGVVPTLDGATEMQCCQSTELVTLQEIRRENYNSYHLLMCCVYLLLHIIQLLSFLLLQDILQNGAKRLLAEVEILAVCVVLSSCGPVQSEQEAEAGVCEAIVREGVELGHREGKSSAASVEPTGVDAEVVLLESCDAPQQQVSDVTEAAVICPNVASSTVASKDSLCPAAPQRCGRRGTRKVGAGAGVLRRSQRLASLLEPGTSNSRTLRRSKRLEEQSIGATEWSCSV